MLPKLRALILPAIFVGRAAIFLQLSQLFGCHPVSPTMYNDSTATRTVINRDDDTRTYTPIYAIHLASAARDNRGTLKGDFRWAAEASNLVMAASRWEKMLELHDPHAKSASSNEGYQDAFQANYIYAAKYELMRVYYLLGRLEDGDRVFRELDPLDLID